MAMAHVPDWDPTRKQKPREATPFEVMDYAPPMTSTMRSQFTPHPYVARKPIKPDSGFDWSALRTQSTVTRSTMQDAFPKPYAFKQVPNQKPVKTFESTPWMQPLTTTSRSSFPNYPGVKPVQAIKPKPEQPLVPTPFNTRSTMSDAYKAAPSNYRRQMPIVPSHNASPFSKEDNPGGWTTTQRSSFVPHMVKPYTPAKKPQNKNSVF